MPKITSFKQVKLKIAKQTNYDKVFNTFTSIEKFELRSDRENAEIKSLKSRYLSWAIFIFISSYFSLLRTSWARPIHFISKTYCCVSSLSLGNGRCILLFAEKHLKKRVHFLISFVLLFKCGTIEVLGENTCQSFYLCQHVFAFRKDTHRIALIYLWKMFFKTGISFKDYYYPFVFTIQGTRKKHG